MANYVIVNGELYHWGIKGQKWGVRRFQNKDGSLTAAGKKRYAHLDTVRKNEADRYKRMAEAEEKSFKANKDYMRMLKTEDGPKQIRSYLGDINNDKESMELYGYKISELVDQEIDYTNHEANINRHRVEAYMNANKALMSMDISDLSMKRKDIVKFGNRIVAETFGSQSSEDVRYDDLPPE